VTQGEWRHPTGGLRMLDDSVAHTHAAGRTFRIDDATVQAFTRYRNGLVAKIDRVLSPADAPLPTGPVPTATVHTNILRFDAFASLSGTPSGHDATDSDSYEFRKFQDNELVIDATRRKSEGPALFFMTDIQWTNILSTGSSVQQPFHLNFAQSFSQIEATTDGVAFTCNDVRFGQGVRPEDKLNWWVGQPGASRDDKTLTLKCRSSTPDCFLVIDSKGGDDTFGASAVCVPPD
jgi:hypothetical protein